MRQRRAVGGDQGRAEAEPAGADPGLGQVDEVVVREEAEQGEQQVPVARMARVRRRHADAEQEHVGRGQHQPEAPDQLAVIEGARLAQQLQRRPRLRRQDLARIDHALAGQRAEAREARQRLLAVARVLLVALALVEDDEAAALAAVDAAAARRGDRLDAAARGDDEDVAAAGGVARRALEEEGALAVARALELPRRDAREVGAPLEHVLELGGALVLPGPDEEGEHRRPRSSTGQLVCSTGRTKRCSDTPLANQIVISLARYMRDSVATTATNIEAASIVGRLPRAM